MAVKTYSLKKDGEKQLTTNFKVKEFKSHDGSDKILIDTDLVNFLQKIRDWAGAAVTVNSGYRTVAYNEAVGGVKNSYHTKGQAADIVVSGKTTLQVARKAEDLGMKGIMRYITKNFVHLDTRSTKYYAKVTNGTTTQVTTFH